MNKARTPTPFSRHYIHSLAAAAAMLAPTVGMTQVAFDPPINFDGGDGMRAVASCDLDRDGYLDLATANKSSGTASVLLNDGTGRFRGAVDYTAGIFPFDLACVDLNGDGTPDLAVANGATNDVSVLLNQGDGTFGAAANFSVGTEPQGIAGRDLDGDSDIDLAVANLGSNTVTILSNDGNGTFSTAATLPVGPEPISIAAADYNHDGKPDLAVLNNAIQVAFVNSVVIRHFGTVSVLLNNGDGSFGGETRYEVATNPFQVISADLDGDGNLDLATANHMVSSAFPNSWLSVLFGNGDGTFAAETKVGTVAGFDSSVAAVDLDQDGAPDLVAAGQWTPGTVEVVMNDGAGGFAAPLGFGAGGLNAPSYITVGDYDRDGDNDVIAASQNSDNFALLLNQLVPNPPPPPAGDPDLIGIIDRMRVKANKGTFQFEFQFNIENVGNAPTGGLFVAQAYLSDDAFLDAADTLIKTFYVLSDIPAGGTSKQKAKLTLSQAPSGKYLVIAVDPFQKIAEADEGNNVTSQQVP